MPGSSQGDPAQDLPSRSPPRQLRAPQKSKQGWKPSQLLSPAWWGDRPNGGALPARPGSSAATGPSFSNPLDSTGTLPSPLWAPRTLAGGQKPALRGGSAPLPPRLTHRELSVPLHRSRTEAPPLTAQPAAEGRRTTNAAPTEPFQSSAVRR